MRVIRLSQPRPECLVVDEGRNWRRAAGWLLGAAAWVGLALLLDPESGFFAAWSVVGLGLLPVCGVAVRRSLSSRTLMVVRSGGKLLLNGEPLELARVELRVTHLPLLKTPTGFSLSLWVMSLGGPEDVPLGHFESMLDASRVAGHLEEFLSKANSRQPGHTPLS